MILSRRVTMDGIQLDSLDSRIIISGIEEDVPGETRNALDIYGRIGSRQTFEHINSKRVTVKFLLKVRKGNFADRNEILEKITKWARYGSELRSSTRPGRKIRVRCTAIPKPTDPRNWTSEYSMTFEAREKPYWENTTIVKATGTTRSSGSVTLELDGNLDNRVTIEARNMSGAVINNMTLECGEDSISFTGLGLAAEETLKIGYSNEDVQSIRITGADGKSRSVMDKRTGSDDLRAEPGSVTVSYTAQRAIQLTAACTGRYA